MTARIVVVGSLNMDLVVRAQHLPAAGETVLGESFATFPGGKGANQAVAAARLGAAVTMIGAVGGDAFGATLRSGLEAAGVAARLAVVDAPTGVALITLDAAGENTIVVAPGANALLGLGAVGSQCEALAADVLALQLEVPLPAVATAIALARAAGTRIQLNAAPAQPLPAELLARLDVLVVNRGEAELLAGTAEDTAPEELAHALQSLGPGLVVVTLGAKGALARHGDLTFVQAGFHVKVVDTVAAGDAFAAAFAVATAEDMPVADALRFACATGALATTKHGAQPSLPTRDEVEAFLATLS